MIKGEARRLTPIDVPTCVRWAEHDPLFPGVGHFPHREDPERAAAEIAAFFTRIGCS